MAVPRNYGLLFLLDVFRHGGRTASSIARLINYARRVIVQEPVMMDFLAVCARTFPLLQPAQHDAVPTPCVSGNPLHRTASRSTGISPACRTPFRMLRIQATISPILLNATANIKSKKLKDIQDARDSAVEMRKVRGRG